MISSVPPDVDRQASVRDRVVQAARLLLYTVGPSVSIDSIVQAAGVARPSVYAHFDSKDALIAVVAEQAVDDYLDLLGSRVAASYEAEAEALVQLPFDLLREGLPDPRYRGCLCLNLAAALPTDAAAARALHRLNEGVLDVFTGILRSAEIDDPVELAGCLLVLFNGAKAMGVLDPTGDAATRAATAARTLLACGRSRLS